ncbi:unnamed protein product [Orchesella dallaii]|uniref:Uncharacterized protein n=1 Tax=Orchesella dallaii TaxID=48710 RepID=A0ABP1RGE4_9HEXA
MIMELDKGFGVRIWKLEEQHFNSMSKSLENSEEEFDLVSDEDEQKWNKIVFETLIFEMLFISIVTIVLFISTIYLVIRIARKISTDTPCEVIFDFLFHILASLALLTGSALVLVAELKIESFADKINDNLPPEVVELISSEHESSKDKKGDKIGAAVYGMVNGVLYALCTVTIRMITPHPLANKIWNTNPRKESTLSKLSTV